MFHFPDASGVTYVEPDPPGLIRYVDPDVPAALAYGARHMDVRSQPRAIHTDVFFSGGPWLGEGARAIA